MTRVEDKLAVFAARRRLRGLALLAISLVLGLPAAITAQSKAPAGRRHRPPTSQKPRPSAATVGFTEPPEIVQGVQEIDQGNPDAALAAASAYQAQHPNDPLGFLLEGEARWWKLYCSQSQIRYGMVDLWALPKKPQNPPYLAAAKESVALATAKLKKGDSARAELWAGMGYALEARIYGLRGERQATAHAGVSARQHLLKAVQLDPSLGDAYTGLGLYNYYVDTLSPIVKLLRFFMGIPGGSKSEGIRQLRLAMQEGRLTAVEARFYLAKNLRTYDRQYAKALAVAEPLVVRYPQNPTFLLLAANLKLELGRKAEAAANLQKLDSMEIRNAACSERVRLLAKRLLAPAR